MLRWACAAATAAGVVLPLISAAVGTTRAIFMSNGQADGLVAAVFLPVVLLELGTAALASAWILVILRTRWRWPFFVHLLVFGALTILFVADMHFALSGGKLDLGGVVVTLIAGLGAVLFVLLLAPFVLHGVWGTRPGSD